MSTIRGFPNLVQQCVRVRVPHSTPFIMIINFPAYRQFRQAHIQANSAMLALLIGNRLGEGLLASPEINEGTRLPEIFNKVHDIRRLNLTAKKATIVLTEAESHLAYMAIPYVLSIHGSYMVDAARMLDEDGHTPKNRMARRDFSKMTIEQVHEYIEECSDRHLDATYLALFHIIRRMRNRIIHKAGTPGSHIDYQNLSTQAKDEWTRIAKRPLSLALEHDRINFKSNEIIAVLAVSQRLAQDVNDLLAQTISREYWASLLVRDYLENYPSRLHPLSHLSGYARYFYRPLGLKNNELEEAARLVMLTRN